MINLFNNEKSFEDNLTNNKNQEYNFIVLRINLKNDYHYLNSNYNDIYDHFNNNKTYNDGFILFIKYLKEEYTYDKTQEYGKYLNDKKYLKTWFDNEIKDKHIYFNIDKSNNVLGFVSFFKKTTNLTFLNGLFVDENSRGKGIATYLLNFAKMKVINENKSDYLELEVFKNNKAAYNLYKKFGFKEYNDWKSYSQENVLNVNKILTLNSQESYFFDEPDIEINLDDWKNNKNKILLIGGISGSGKSFLSKSLGEKYNANYVELDLVGFLNKTFEGNLDKIKELDISVYDFVKKYPDQLHNDDFFEIQEKYLEFIKTYNFKTRVILEGIGIIDAFDKDIINDKDLNKMSLIIKGTSTFKSNRQALKRDIYNDEKDMSPEEKQSNKYKFNKLKMIIKRYLNQNDHFTEDQLKRVKKKLNYDFGFNYLVKNKIKLDPNPSNDKLFKWDKDIIKTKIASCSEFSMFIFKDNIKKNLNSFIAKIGYYNENFGRYHIIAGYYLNNKTYIQNYADVSFYEIVSYNDKPKDAIKKYLVRFSKVMKEHMGLNNINTLKSEALLSTNVKEVLNKYEYTKITQKEILTLLNFK